MFIKNGAKKGDKMKIGIVLNTDDIETCWNVLRLSNVALQDGNHVEIFLLGKGVLLEDIKSRKFNVEELVKTFRKKGGVMRACATCLSLRKKKVCKIGDVSNLRELVNMLETYDKVLTFD